MFTGIVGEVGHILGVTRSGDMRARIATRRDPASIDLGASIACDGVCLTVVATGDWATRAGPMGAGATRAGAAGAAAASDGRHGDDPAGEGGAAPAMAGWFDVQVSSETVARTNLSGWAPGRRVNLERALRVGDELGGHIVSGHVDGLAEVTAMRAEGGSLRLTFRAPDALAGFIAPKGSVALNGTSLTVNEVEGASFGVNLIPHTRAVTTWDEAATGQRVNLEIDTLARYVARLREWGA